MKADIRYNNVAKMLKSFCIVSHAIFIHGQKSGLPKSPLKIELYIETLLQEFGKPVYILLRIMELEPQTASIMHKSIVCICVIEFRILVSVPVGVDDRVLAVITAPRMQLLSADINSRTVFTPHAVDDTHPPTGRKRMGNAGNVVVPTGFRQQNPDFIIVIIVTILASAMSFRYYNITVNIFCIKQTSPSAVSSGRDVNILVISVRYFSERLVVIDSVPPDIRLESPVIIGFTA